MGNAIFKSERKTHGYFEYWEIEFNKENMDEILDHISNGDHLYIYINEWVYWIYARFDNLKDLKFEFIMVSLSTESSKKFNTITDITFYLKSWLFSGKIRPPSRVV